jgi:hypothetical protein
MSRIAWRLTQRVEDDAGFQHGDVDHISPGWSCVMAGSLDAPRVRLGLVPLDESVAEVLDKERKEQARHKNSCGSGFVRQFPETLIGKHERRVSEEL